MDTCPLDGHWFRHVGVDCFILFTASGNVQSCVLIGLQFFHVGVAYDRAPYGVCIFENEASDSFIVEMISPLCSPHLIEINTFRL